MTFLPVNENTADADNLRKFWEQCKSDSTGKKLNVSESSGTGNLTRNIQILLNEDTRKNFSYMVGGIWNY